MELTLILRMFLQWFFFTGDERLKPFYASKDASGADLFAAIEESLVLLPTCYVAVPTGIKMEIPTGWEGQIRPRSGLARHKGVTLLNSPGTIDGDYRGEIEVLLINHGSDTVCIQPYDRIAQIVLNPVFRAEFQRSPELGKSGRGEGGFGSTGT